MGIQSAEQVLIVVRRYVFVASIASVLIGAIVLVGWFFDIGVLKNIGIMIILLIMVYSAIELFLISRNISGHGQTEGLLHQSERAAHTILNATPDVIIIIDKAGNIIHLNAQIENIFGYQITELLGHPIEILIPNRFQNNHIQHRANYSKERYRRTMGVEMELYGRRKDGSEFPVDVKLIPISNIADWDVLVTIADITGQKQAAKEIHRLNHELKQYVDELETTNQELVAFSYAISHDLKAPLRGITSCINILTEDYELLLDAEGKQVCGIISAEAQRMGKLLDGLLMFSRLGRSEIRMTVIDMKAMVKQVFDELTRIDNTQKIDFHLSELPLAGGDALLIYQMWTNLLSNAIKFTSKKENSLIEVSATQADGETTYIIHDNGAGFDMKYANKLFGLFERLHGEREFEGTGVGLAIAHRIVHRHGGKIRGEGERGKGATFYVTLPMIEETVV